MTVTSAAYQHASNGAESQRCPWLLWPQATGPSACPPPPERRSSAGPEQQNACALGQIQDTTRHGSWPVQTCRQEKMGSQ